MLLSLFSFVLAYIFVLILKEKPLNFFIPKEVLGQQGSISGQSVGSWVFRYHSIQEFLVHLPNKSTAII